MDETTKKAIKKTILALRKLLERQDIPSVLKQYGIFPDGRRVPVEKLALLDENGKKRRTRLEAIIDREVQAVGGEQKSGVERYCREVAFTCLNRLIALRSMEVRGLIDECIKIRDDYAGRSLRHHRFLKENPGIQFDAEDTESLKAFLRAVFRELQDDIKILFDPDDEYSIVMPAIQALRECIRSLNEDIPEDAFKEPELIGWVYQYFQTEEKDRVFEEVRTKKKKIEGDDIVPATSLYTERYMVDYLVQNSLGTIWMEMYPDSKLWEKWPYFVKNQDLKPREPRPVKSLTFLDPASGSGHFHLVAFDLLMQMYEEETRLAAEGKIPKEWVVPKDKIATTLLESNLHGIDIDLRSVQLSYLVLYLRMRDHQKSVGVPKSFPAKINLVAADASLLNTPEFLSWCEERFKEEPYAINIIKGIVGRLRNLSEVGSLARPEEDLKELIHREKERLLSAWKKEKNPRQAFLFREMLAPEQQELPFEKITDDQFWEGVLSRVTKAIDEYYKEASERGDTKSQVLAHEASRGFKFLELSNKRYDVVATNPPFMGSKNMGKNIKEYLQRLYPDGASDLYASFILRNRSLTSERGIVAMVTQQSWMFLRSFVDLREKILIENCIQTLAHLGEHAFDDPAAAGAFVVLFTLAKQKALPDNHLFAFRLIGSKSPAEKASLLSQAIEKLIPSIGYSPLQLELLKVPNMPLAYWVSKSLLVLFAINESVEDYAICEEGYKTADNDRFLRFFWEVDENNNWLPYEKGGGYRKWAGFKYYLLDWRLNGKFLRSYPGSTIPRDPGHNPTGLTYSEIARGSLGFRYMANGSAYDFKAHAVFAKRADIDEMIAWLNSRLATYLIRVLSPSIYFNQGYVATLPYRPPNNKIIKILARTCNALKEIIISRDPTERSFSGSMIKHCKGKSIINRICTELLEQWRICALLHSFEGILDSEVFRLYQVEDFDITTILEETGSPAGWFPLLIGYDKVPDSITELNLEEDALEHLQAHMERHPRLQQQEVSNLQVQFNRLLETGENISPDRGTEGENYAEANPEGSEKETFIGGRLPIPSETKIEKMSTLLKIHPLSVYWLLQKRMFGGVK